MRGAGAAVAPHNGRPQRRQQQQQQQHRSSSRWALPLALLRLRRLLPRRPPALRRLTSHRRGRRLLVLTIALTCALMVLLGGQRLLPALASADGNPSTSQLLSSLLARTSPLLSVQSAPPPPPPPPAPSPDFEPLANLTPLPAFTAAPLPKFNSNNVSGPTSYVLGATLTRDARLGQREDEETEALLVDVFFMGVSGMVGGTTFSGVEQDKGASPEWRAAAGTIVKDVRRMAVEDGYAFACRFRLAHAWGGDDGEEEQEEEASVPAIVVPTATTVDGNVNDMVNVLRCSLPEAVAAFCRRHRSGELQVALLEHPPATAAPTYPRPLLNFSLPIATRSTGFLQPHTTTTTNSTDSQTSLGPHGLDPWARLWDTHPRLLSPQRNHSVALCVAGLRSAFVSPLAELAVEFIEHHLLQGVGTIVFGVDYDVGDKDWRRMALVLRQYVQEGRVVMSSTRAVGGREVHRELKKVYHYNQCLYWSKGLAEWVGVWDVDEFLTPRGGPPATLLSLLDAYASPHHNAGHDVGFLLFTSYSHALPLPEAAALEVDADVHLPLDDSDDRIHWLGRRFARTREDGHDDGYQKSLLSARHIYFTGFHLPGACTARADPERDWGKLLRDDDPEFAFYAKPVAKEDAAVFHFRVVLKPITYVRSKVWEASEYALHYFDAVLRRIQERGLERLLVEFKTLHKPCPDERARERLE